MSSTHTFRLPLLAALCTWGTGCATLDSDTTSPRSGPRGDKEADERKELGRKLDVAKLELDLARLEAAQELDGAERELAKARIEAAKAKLEREAFLTLGKARELDEARLGLDQSRGRAEDAAAELAELEAMYKDEEFAKKTKELVLARSRRDLELARRALDLAERKLKETEGFDLATKERELEQGDLAGEMGVVEAEKKLEKLRLEQKLALTKAEQELAELTEKLAKTNDKDRADGEKAEPKP